MILPLTISLKYSNLTQFQERKYSQILNFNPLTQQKSKHNGTKEQLIIKRHYFHFSFLSSTHKALYEPSFPFFFLKKIVLSLRLTNLLQHEISKQYYHDPLRRPAAASNSTHLPSVHQYLRCNLTLCLFVVCFCFALSQIKHDSSSRLANKQLLKFHQKYNVILQ